MTVTRSEAARIWAKIGLLSFGGPAAQIATMHRLLVQEKAWIDESRFLHGLNFCMVLPGPEALQLAIYLGWLLHGGWGGMVAGALFILPGLVALMGLSLIYVLFGQLVLVGAAFFGLKAAVIAVIFHAVKRLGASALATPQHYGLAAFSFAAIFLFNLPFPLILVTAAVAGLLGAAQRTLPPLPFVGPGLFNAAKIIALWGGLWLLPVVGVWEIWGADHILTSIALFFGKMAVMTFGGAYAILAYMAQEVVQHHHWLGQGEMLDGLGMAETTPGPLIMVVQFVGFMAAYHQAGDWPAILAGVAGGLLASWVTFTPCFLWVFLGGPYVERLHHAPALAGALRGISAAVVGVILNLGVWFALHTLFRQQHPIAGWEGVLHLDIPVWSSLNVTSLGLVVGALLALFWLRIGMMTVLGLGAALGIALTLVW